MPSPVHLTNNPKSSFSIPGFSNLFTGSTLNALDLYMKYTAEVVPLHTYINSK